MATAPQTLPGHRERFLYCGWIFCFMTTEAEGRKGRHSAQNGMLAVEQASSVRWVSAKRSGGTGRSQDHQQSLLCPSQALTSFCIYLQKAGYRLQGRRQRCPTTCSENRAAQTTFRLRASHRAWGLLTSSTVLPFPTQRGRTARSLLQVSQTDWITRGTTKADPPSHFSSRSRAGMPKM